jgi:hypothetical protein
LTRINRIEALQSSTQPQSIITASKNQAIYPAPRCTMQSNEDTLAALTSGPEHSSETSMESLLNSYGEQNNLNRASTHRRTTFQPAQRTAILDDLSDILHLRGHLQQMGCNFSSSGQLLTYGNPPSPTDFEDMLKLGPLYEEQWATFFVEGYVPNRGSSDEDITGYLWSYLRTLKKMLQNEGVVFGREHQRYSFGDSSTKLRRLCCAYDELRMEWLEMMRTSLPVHDDADLATVVDGDGNGEVAEGDSGFIDGSSPPRADATVQYDSDRACITGRPPILQVRSSGVVRNIGWRFSDDHTPPPRSNAWRFSDNLSSVPAWKDVQGTTATKVDDTAQILQQSDEHVRGEIPIVLHTVLDQEPVSPPPVPAKDNRQSIYPASNGVFGSEIWTATPATPTLIHPAKRISMLHGPSPLRVSHGPIFAARKHSLTDPQHVKTPSMMTSNALAMDPRGHNLHVDPLLTTYIENAVIVNVQEPKEEKTGKKIRRWFKQTFGRK